MTAVAQAGLLVAFPVAATVIGAVASVFFDLGRNVTRGIQHFAAGVVVAAFAGEVLPDLREDGHLLVVLVAFSAGVGLLIGLDQLASRAEAATAARVIPMALVVTVGIDFLIDGVLIGLGAIIGSTASLVLTIALTMEVLFLGLAVATTLRDRGATRTTAALVPSLLGLLTAVGAIGGAFLLDGASTTLLAAVLAFGAAALLYLVTEELLVEAHEGEETPILTAMFFLGFILIYALAA